MKTVPVVFKAATFCGTLLISACGGSSSSGNSADIAKPPVTNVPVPEIRILVLGQSIASNCNEKMFGPSPNVFQVDSSGGVKAASDPFDWADCKQGSMWMPLGKQLIDAGIASKVTFMPIGVGATTVADWQQGGRAFAKLNSAIDVVKRNNIQFDYAFWHQGSSDAGLKREVYASRLTGVLAYVSKNVKISSWLIALHSRCNGIWDREIEAAQLSISTLPGDRIFVGANNNSLDETYRFDSCHLNVKGQDAMANLWLEAIKNAKE